MADLKSIPGTELRVRRSVDDLSALDVSRLRRAFQASMQTSDDRGYRYWAGIHGLPPPMHGSHHRPDFLPWHRVYLVEFEVALRTFEPGVTLPWWDWSSGLSQENGMPPAYTAPTIDGEPNPLYAFEIDAVQGGEEKGAPTETFREPGPPAQLPGQGAIERLLAIGDFETFGFELERLHDQIHIWIGGTNGSIPYASYDPFFWAYQASIDRIWWLWQQAHPDAEAPQSIAERDLVPFSTLVREAWDTSLLGYEYVDRTTRSGFLAGAASDRPATTDQLNFTDYAQAFAEIIASPHTTPPLTIGIYGSWGIGKSSLLEMIAGEFSDQRNPDAADVHVVEFNAWEYNSSEKIWPSLVRRIMERMEEEAQWGFWERFVDTFKRNLRRDWQRYRSQLVAVAAILIPLLVLAAWKFDFSLQLILGTLVAIGIPGLLKIGTEAVQNPVSRWVGTLVEQGKYGDELPYMREIHDDLRFLTERMQSTGDRVIEPGAEDEAGQQVPRVLVTIDDLDRCEPAKAVEVLQAINLLLDFPVFVVCLGIDARIITAAVEAHYKELLGIAGASGYEYLDKIVQIPFRIPIATASEVQEFLKSQMPVVSAPDSTEAGSSGEDDSPPSDSSTEYDSQPSDPNVEGENAGEGPPPPIDYTMFDQVEVAGFQEQAQFIRRNPRHIKRLVNVYRMVRTLAARRGVDEILDNPKLTIAWIVICAQWPYTVSAMLEAFEVIVEEVDSGGEYPDGPPLWELYQRVRADLSPSFQRQVDDDIEDLEKLLERTTMTWVELGTMQLYTLNFNPAIEEALHRGLSASSTAPNSTDPLSSPPLWES